MPVNHLAASCVLLLIHETGMCREVYCDVAVHRFPPIGNDSSAPLVSGVPSGMVLSCFPYYAQRNAFRSSYFRLLWRHGGLVAALNRADAEIEGHRLITAGAMAEAILHVK